MIRLFVGCSANGEDAEAQAMLEYTVRKYASEPVEINWMKLSRDPESPWYSNPTKREGWNTQLWATPFSVFRWAIPYVCHWRGKAIYQDVDQILRGDIADLWKQRIPDGKAILSKSIKHSCVMLMDCERLKGKIMDFEKMRRMHGGYSVIRNSLAPYMATFSGNWNCLDGETYKTLDDPDIRIIHFTKVETQPHLKYALPRLAKEGIRHWNGLLAGQAHARPDVQPLVDQIWAEAQAAGYAAEQYKPQQPFGPYDAVRGGARAA